MGRIARYALLLLILAGVAAAPRTVVAQPELSGVYMSQGVNPDGTQYRGFVHIVRQRDSFVVSWIFPDGTNRPGRVVPTSVGIGIVSGGTLAVSYYSPRMIGVIVYRIEEEGQRLAGQWAVAGQDGTVYAETLTKLPGEVPEPSPSAPPERERPSRPAEPRLPVGVITL